MKQNISEILGIDLPESLKTTITNTVLSSPGNLQNKFNPRSTRLNQAEEAIRSIEEVLADAQKIGNVALSEGYNLAKHADSSKGVDIVDLVANKEASSLYYENWLDNITKASQEMAIVSAKEISFDGYYKDINKDELTPLTVSVTNNLVKTPEFMQLMLSSESVVDKTHQLAHDLSRTFTFESMQSLAKAAVSDAVEFNTKMTEAQLVNPESIAKYRIESSEKLEVTTDLFNQLTRVKGSVEEIVRATQVTSGQSLAVERAISQMNDTLKEKGAGNEVAESSIKSESRGLKF